MYYIYISNITLLKYRAPKLKQVFRYQKKVGITLCSPVINSLKANYYTNYIIKIKQKFS